MKINSVEHSRSFIWGRAVPYTFHLSFMKRFKILLIHFSSSTTLNWFRPAFLRYARLIISPSFSLNWNVETWNPVMESVINKMLVTLGDFDWFFFWKQRHIEFHNSIWIYAQLFKFKQKDWKICFDPESLQYWGFRLNLQNNMGKNRKCKLSFQWEKDKECQIYATVLSIIQRSIDNYACNWWLARDLGAVPNLGAEILSALLKVWVNCRIFIWRPLVFFF